jgi:hypothetical protein
MSEKKKKWSTPQFVVLMRGRPEEGILLACKNMSIVHVGPGYVYSDTCTNALGGCVTCSAVVTSS